MKIATPRKDGKANNLRTYLGKPCKHCGGTERYVLGYGCVVCSRIKGRKKLDNKELMSKYRTKDKIATRVKRWRVANYDKYQQQWLKSDKTSNNARQAKRRAQRLNQTPPDADLQRIEDIYEKCRLLTEITSVSHEVDHRIPIVKGGLHHQDNLQIITKAANRTKGGR